MMDEHLHNPPQAETTAPRRLPIPGTTPTPAGSATKSFRIKVVIDHLTIEPVPTDASNTVLPFVVLVDLVRRIDVVTWPDVRTGKTKSVPPNTDLTNCWLIAARSQADWQAVRPQVLDGNGNGEPGGATNGTGHA